jgi:hypothetical protein
VQLDALIFVDTNILLDLYRIRKSDVSLAYLDRLEDCKDRLIIGSQVEMEFKKNRQKVILETLKVYATPDWGKLTPPALLSDFQPSKMIEKNKKEITKQQKKVKDKVEKILQNPTSNDPVFQKLNRIFKRKSAFNLDRESDDRFRIRRLARKRFSLGYPPRKDTDNSFGDSINWEWIIECAKNTDKEIIIVTRDTDFGAIYDGKSYLNDWLKKEFQERVNKKRKILLTDKLSVALKAVSEVVTQEMEDEEERIQKIIAELNSMLGDSDSSN